MPSTPPPAAELNPVGRERSSLAIQRQRQRMVRDQLHDCPDARVVEAMASLPREDFVPPDVAAQAYADGPLPIGAGQTISQPYVVAHMLAALRLGPGLRVLDVGCGSGYAAALMARLVAPYGCVIALERIAALASQAAQRLAPRRVQVLHADGGAGHPAGAPYDAIHVACVIPEPPPALLAQLAIGGRLVIPLGDPAGEQELVVIECQPTGYHRRPLFPVRFVPFLPGTG